MTTVQKRKHSFKVSAKQSTKWQKLETYSNKSLVSAVIPSFLDSERQLKESLVFLISYTSYVSNRRSHEMRNRPWRQSHALGPQSTIYKGYQCRKKLPSKYGSVENSVILNDPGVLYEKKMIVQKFWTKMWAWV